MAFNIAKYGKKIALMFNDSMSIYRYQDVESDVEEGGDGTTEITLPESPKYSNIACKLSFKDIESPSDSKEDVTPTNSTVKLFCANSVDIIAGDFVVVMRDGVKYEGQVSRPNVYPTHMELYLYEKKDA